MIISLDEVLDLAHRYHMAICTGASAKDVGDFFTHPNGIAVHVLHGQDLTIQGVLDIVNGYTDQHFIPMDPYVVRTGLLSVVRMVS